MADAWLGSADLDEIADAVAGSRTARCRIYRQEPGRSPGGAPASGPWGLAGEVGCRVESVNRVAIEHGVGGAMAADADLTVSMHRRVRVLPTDRIWVAGKVFNVTGVSGQEGTFAAETVVAVKGLGASR